jgi:hypothetical protein
LSVRNAKAVSPRRNKFDVMDVDVLAARAAGVVMPIAAEADEVAVKEMDAGIDGGAPIPKLPLLQIHLGEVLLS